MHALGMSGTFSPATTSEASVSLGSQHASWHVRHALAYSAFSCYLNQCLVIVKLQWHLNQNTKLFSHKNASGNIGFEMGAILSRGYELICGRCFNANYRIFCILLVLTHHGGPLLGILTHPPYCPKYSLMNQVSISSSNDLSPIRRQAI